MEFPRSSLDKLSGCAEDTRKIFMISEGGELFTNPIFGLGKLAIVKRFECLCTAPSMGNLINWNSTSKMTP